jgi:hypothetical protein
VGNSKNDDIHGDHAVLTTLVDTFLSSLTTKLGLQRMPPQTDEGVVLRTVFPDTHVDITILVREEEDLVGIWCPVAKIANNPEDAGIAYALMSANLLGAGTKGLTFAISPKEGLVYLGHCLLHPGVDSDSFESCFARVVMVGAHMKRQFGASPATRID